LDAPVTRAVPVPSWPLHDPLADAGSRPSADRTTRGGPEPVTDRRIGPRGNGRPWSKSAFWILQLVVLAIYLIRLASLVEFHLGVTSLVAEFSTLVLFIIPVVYAALSYGFSGAVFTAGWVALLALPRIFSYLGAHQYTATWFELTQLVLLGGLAGVIGLRVSAERQARRRAEVASEAHLSAEALYRDLFDSNQAPIVIIDANGFVVEVNASAQRAFGGFLSETSESLSLPAPGSDPPTAASPIRLVDVIGPDAAARVLTQLISEHPEGGGIRSGDERRRVERVEPVAFEVDGHSVLYRPAATMLGPAEDDRRMQVVFEDVTAETRRHDRMEAYASRVVSGQEEERRHIAQEIHDGPVQTLIHLCRQIDAVESSSGPVDGDATALSDLRIIVEDTVSELRSIAKGLRPSILDDLGLVASINQMLADAGERHQFETTFGVTGPERRLPPPVELALFRIAQEALSNAARHAAAGRVAVGIDFDSGGLRLLVKDDGVGFDGSEGAEGDGHRSLGLSGMSERAHLIGARLVVHSGRGSGTTVDVRVPATILA
jgi:signal transduction histidine kinase